MLHKTGKIAETGHGSWDRKSKRDAGVGLWVWSVLGSCGIGRLEGKEQKSWLDGYPDIGRREERDVLL